MGHWLALWQKEPVRALNAVRAILVAAVAFGLHITAEQKAALLAVVELVLLTPIQRSSVVSPQTVHDAGHSVSDIIADAKANREGLR